MQTCKLPKRLSMHHSPKNITLIGQDTDLLNYCTNKSRFKLFFRSDKQNKKKENVVHDIYHYRTIMWEELCYNLLFIHAFSGCDTTSRFCGIGKFDLFIRNVNLRKLAEEFSKTGKTQERMEEAGEMAAHILYNVKEGESINALRKRLLFTKVGNDFCKTWETTTNQICSKVPQFQSFSWSLEVDWWR